MSDGVSDLIVTQLRELGWLLVELACWVLFAFLFGAMGGA